MDRELDVFVIIYTSKVCKVCDELWPIFIQVAKLLKKTHNLRFTSINMALNELPEE